LIETGPILTAQMIGNDMADPGMDVRQERVGARGCRQLTLSFWFNDRR
jgi:hypothetical protein